MEGHPTTEDFARFLQKSSRPSHAERNALVVRHLLADCAICRRTVLEIEGATRLLSRLLDRPLRKDEPETLGSHDYDWAFAKTARALATLLAGGGPAERLPELLAELSDLPEGEQVRRVSAETRFAIPDFIDCLLERSHDSRYRSPRKTLHLARLAHLAAGACNPEAAGGEAELADLRTRAWAQYANALRISGRLVEAEEAFAAAQRHRETGTGDPILHAWLLERLMAFATSQGRFGEAMQMSEGVEEIYRQLSKSHLLASTLVRKAIAALYSGDAERAVEILNEAIPLIDPAEDSQLFLAAHHNLIRCYIDLDRPDEALALHYMARHLYQECEEDPLILLRALWQEGQLLREIGHLHNAETALLRTRDGFLEQGLAYEGAIVCLDLADVYSKLGEADKLRQVVTEALPVFRTLQVDRELLASLLWLKQTALELPPQAGDGESQA